MPSFVVSNNWSFALPQATNAEQPGYIVYWTNSNGAAQTVWNFPVPYSIYKAKGWSAFTVSAMPAGVQSIAVNMVAMNGYESNVLQTNWVSPVVYPMQITVNADLVGVPLSLWSGTTPTTANPTNGTFIAGFISGVQTFRITNSSPAMFYGVSTN